MAISEPTTTPPASFPPDAAEGFAIGEIAVLAEPAELAGGRAVLAHLTISYGPIRMARCQLVRTGPGRMTLWFPGSPIARIEVPPSVHQSLLRRAINLYQGVAGVASEIRR